MTIIGLVGIIGYIAPIVVVTSSYARFQTANNTMVMANVRPEQRGVIRACATSRAT